MQRAGRLESWGGLLALALVSIGFGALSPALAEVQAAFGGGATFGALLVGGFGAGRLMAGFPSGVLVNRVRPSTVILAGAGLFVVASLLGWAAPTFQVLMLARVLQGAALGIVPAGVLAQVMEGASEGRAGGSMALYQAAISGGAAFGPAIGGPLAAAFGWRSALLYCVAAGLLACAATLPSIRRRAARPSTPAAAKARLGWGMWPLVLLALTPNAVASFDRSAVGLLVLPLYAAGPIGLDPAGTGLLLGTQTLVTIAALAPAGWATDRFGVRPTIVVAGLLAAGGIGLMPLLPGTLGIWLATGVYGVGLSALGVAGGLYVFTVPGASRGTLVGLYRLSTDLLQMLAPLAAGLALEGSGFEPVFFGMAAFGLLALTVLLPFGRGRSGS